MKQSEKEKVRERFLVKGGSEVDLSRGFKSGLDQEAITKETAKEHLDGDIKRIAHYQDILYAQNCYSLLIIFQAMDAAGKDGTIKHVMSGINPQGCQVFAFKAPSEEELDHAIFGAVLKPFQSAAELAFLTVRIMKKFWSPACTQIFWRSSICQQNCGAKAYGKSALNRSITLRNTWSRMAL